MEQLKVIGTEDDVLVLVTESGDRFSLAVDDVLRVELRKARKERDGDAQVVRPSPRDIQMHIRAGMSAEETSLGLSVPLSGRHCSPAHAVGGIRSPHCAVPFTRY